VKKTLFSSIIIALALCFFLSPTNSPAGQANLAWDPPDISTDVTGYMIHYGTASGAYSQTVDVGNTTSYTVSNLSDEQTYYFAVTAYNAVDYQSVYSNEVSKSVNPATDPVPNPATDPVPNPKAVRDILWRNTTTGQNALWYMEGVTQTGSAVLTTVANLKWTIAGLGDFNADGKPDILWRNTTTGQNVVWYMDGETFTGYAYLTTVPGRQWAIVGVGDFNGDGKPDILWRNTTTGQNVVWYMNGATFTGYAYLTAVPDRQWTIVGVGDFNGDGKPDILWRNTSTGHNAVWYMNGVTFTGSKYLPREPDQTWTIAGVSDLNNDANPDILWRNIGPGPNAGKNRVWNMNGSTVTGVDVLPFLSTSWKMEGM
jgi:hypothetical protein